MATISLLSVDRTLERRLCEALGEHVAVEMIQSLELADMAGPGVVVIDHASVPAERSLASSIAQVLLSAPGRGVVVATDDMQADQVLQAIRAGAADVFSRNADQKHVSEVLTRLLNTSLTAQGRLGGLTLVIGNEQEAMAILASDMALAHSRNGASCLLVDCTLPCSTAEAYLDLKVDYGLAAAIADIDRMDTSLLSDALARHEESGLSLLTFDGGTGAEPAGIGPNDIIGLVQLLRANFGQVVLGAGSLRHPGLLRELASQATAVELVCSQSIGELDSCRRLLEKISLDTATAARLRLLVWDHDPRILLDGRRMADALGINPVMAVQIDRVRARNALNAGKPMMLDQDGGPYAQAIRRICNIAVPAKGSVIAIDRMRRAVLRRLEKTA
ncbi:histidine kinase [Novosphingobium sp. BL-8A]|uniref:AAA family ATPase n=1 Tax=Novosphingobium sp. BL-8A TaxID=3127639 RepID=UPI0037573CC5